MPFPSHDKSQEQAIAEFKKHGETLGETKTKQDLIEKDIAGLILSVQEIKKAQSVNNSQPKDGLSDEQREAKSALFKHMRGDEQSAKEFLAIEYFDFNVAGAYMGEGTPLITTTNAETVL